MLENLQQAIARVQGLTAYATYKDKLTNIFGVVVECDAPRDTSGTDLIQTIQVVDESCPEGVALCIFGKDVAAMPRAQLGDILELQNIIVQFWQDRPQLFAKMSKPHTFGFTLYRSTGGTMQPVQQFNVTRDSHHASERLPQLQALRLQALGHASATVYLRRIHDLAPPEEEGQRPPFVDMRVRVLAIDQRPGNQEVIMYVWDGTDAKPVSASLQMMPSEWKGTQLRATRPRRHVMPLMSDPPGLQVLQDLPTIGTALPVIMDHVPSTGLPDVGDWVKIKVVGVAAVQGQWQVVFVKPSRLTQSQPSQDFEAWYQTRLANQDTCEWPQDMSQLASVCSIPSMPRSTIRQVLLQTAQQQPGPFRVQLRLIGYLPQDLQLWCKTRPQEVAGVPVWEWAAHLWLEDATGELRALLLGQEGTKLLGVAPQCLSQAPALEQLRARLEHLASVDIEGGVWMDVALTPVYPAQQGQQAGQQFMQAPAQQLQLTQPSHPQQQQEDPQPAGMAATLQNPASQQVPHGLSGQTQGGLSEDHLQQEPQQQPGRAVGDTEPHSLAGPQQQQLSSAAPGGMTSPQAYSRSAVPVFILHDAVMMPHVGALAQEQEPEPEGGPLTLQHEENSGQQEDSQGGSHEDSGQLVGDHLGSSGGAALTTTKLCFESSHDDVE